MLITKEQLKNLALATIDEMNNNLYCRNVIFPHGKAGMLQKAIEIGMLLQHQKLYPEHEVYHPDDHLGMPDVYSDKYNDGYEIKVTIGWKWNGKEYMIRWTNGTIQHSDENFVFLKVMIDKDNDNKCVIDEMYIDNISYDDWTIKKCNNSMYISKTIVANLCEKLI